MRYDFSWLEWSRRHSLSETDLWFSKQFFFNCLALCWAGIFQSDGMGNRKRNRNEFITRFDIQRYRSIVQRHTEVIHPYTQHTVTHRKQFYLQLSKKCKRKHFRCTKVITSEIKKLCCFSFVAFFLGIIQMVAFNEHTNIYNINKPVAEIITNWGYRNVSDVFQMKGYSL